MNEADRIEIRQKINIVKNFINRFDSANKQNIEKQLQTHEWIIKLIEEQLQKYKTYFMFGENFENYNLQKKINLIQMLPFEKEIKSSNFRRKIKRFTKYFYSNTNRLS